MQDNEEDDFKKCALRNMKTKLYLNLQKINVLGKL